MTYLELLLTIDTLFFIGGVVVIAKILLDWKVQYMAALKKLWKLEN